MLVSSGIETCQVSGFLQSVALVMLPRLLFKNWENTFSGLAIPSEDTLFQSGSAVLGVIYAKASGFDEVISAPGCSTAMILFQVHLGI